MAPISLPVEQLNGASTDTNGVHPTTYDVIVVGAGFSGISALYRLRKDGLKTHLFERGSDFGGTWYWNRYPGARVDSEMPFYQLNIPEVYNTWTFSERFPDHHEIRRYMAHIDKTLELRKDCSFNAAVNSCTWDAEAALWTVKTKNGEEAKARWVVLGSGLLTKAHIPDWPGKEQYTGEIYHSAAWPEGKDMTGKRVAVIGAGATGVQIVQEMAKVASHLTVLVRRPSFCIPMRQRPWTAEEQQAWRAYYPALFNAGRHSASGFPSVREDCRVQDVTPEVREKHYEATWKAGGFQFGLRNYNNVVLDPEANKIVYEFWKKKVHARLTDPKKYCLMAPDEQPFYFSTKRTPLETDYYDVLNQDNVEILDLNEHPIETFTKAGMRFAGEDQEREFDYVICATGFEAFSGSVTTMGLKNKDGVDIKDLWAKGVRTYLGMTMSGFPNLALLYSPQAPNALANGPTIIECQRDLICDIIKQLREQGALTLEAQRDAEDEWKAAMDADIKRTLFQYTNSWWNSANIPDRKPENQSYILGIETYEAKCRDVMNGWKGFDVRYAKKRPFEDALGEPKVAVL